MKARKRDYAAEVAKRIMLQTKSLLFDCSARQLAQLGIMNPDTIRHPDDVFITIKIKSRMIYRSTSLALYCRAGRALQQIVTRQRQASGFVAVVRLDG
eukprot:scaffold7561_cov227-Skeletonema_dohrnii-CCMP3373.AAC.10